jgi:hypothetical protein
MPGPNQTVSDPQPLIALLYPEQFSVLRPGMCGLLTPSICHAGFTE